MGSEPSLRRPVLIVQDNAFNRSRIATVVILGIISNLKIAESPGNVFLPKNETGLPKESVVNVTQIATVDKSWLDQKAGRLSPELMEEVDFGLGMILGLD
jgi:mRNA interferase MazF